jgi:WD40 repeat protein
MHRFPLIALLAGLVVGPATAQPPAKKGPSPSVRSLSFSPDGTRLAAAVAMPGGGRVLVWDVAGWKRAAVSDKTGDTPNAVFAPDGKAIAVADGKATVTLIDATTGKTVGSVGPFPAEITAVVPGAKGQWVVLGKDWTFRLWDEGPKKVVHTVAWGKRVWGWAVSPGGAWLLISADTGERLWNLQTGEAVPEALQARQGIVNRGVFIGDDRFLGGNNNGTHRLFEIPSGKELLRFKNEGGPDVIAYSAAAGMMANRYSSDTRAGLTPLTFRAPTAAEADRVAALLKECDSDDYATRERAAAELPKLGPAVEPLLKKASADGPSAEVRMRARVARETLLNTPKFRLAGHTDEIRPMVFSPDGKVFATGGADGLVILWDPATGKELARLSADPDAKP